LNRSVVLHPTSTGTSSFTVPKRGKAREGREAQETVAGGGETEAARGRRERNGGDRGSPAMERYHPSEVYELFVGHMNTPR
jgi:hypothetical protein